VEGSGTGTVSVKGRSELADNAVGDATARARVRIDGDKTAVETEALSPFRLPAQARYLKGAIVPFASFWRGLTVTLNVTSRANPLDANPPAKRIVCSPEDSGGSRAQ